jgi:hypothetical protein
VYAQPLALLGAMADFFIQNSQILCPGPERAGPFEFLSPAQTNFLYVSGRKYI